MSDLSVVSPVLVGRAENLATLEALLEQTARGAAHIALIAGEAGIGKTRLVAEIIQRAEKRGAQILKGNCFETDRTLPYAPFTDLLSNWLTQRPALGIARELAPILPDSALRPPPPTLDPELDKRRLFHALAEFLGAQADPSALIVVEDLHWCDDTSLEFLLHLTRRIEQHAILLLLTYRIDEGSAALEHFLAQLDRTRLSTDIRLNRLAPQDTDSMLRAIFNLNRPVRIEFLNVLHALTEGNPFFIEEVLKSLIVTGDIYFAEGVWDRKPIEALQIPRSVQDAVHRRTEKISAGARETLRYAAVAGRRFDLRLIQELTRMSEQELTQVVKELVDAQLVVEESADVFAFRHALTREAAYTTMLIRERKDYHRKIAETIETLYASSLETNLADLAYHFYQAEAWEKALHYAERAGLKAQRLYAPREAAEQFTRAIESARRLGIFPSPGLLRARGEAFEMLGDFTNAQVDFHAALEGARAARDREIEWATLIDLGKLWTSRDYAKSGEYFQAALEGAREIGDVSKIASSLNRIGNWNSNLDRPNDAISALAEALTNFTRLQDRAGLAETSDLLAMAYWIGGDLSQATTYYQQAVKLFRQVGDRQGLVSSLATLALRSGKYKTETVALPFPKLSDANADGEEALKLAREIESRSGEAYALWCLGAALASQGECGRALALVQDSLAIAEEIQHQQWRCAAHTMLGGIYLDLFALPDALNHLERAAALAEAVGSLHWIRIANSRLALALLAKKDLARADEILNRAMPQDAPMDSVGKRQCWLARGELALAQGDTDHAHQIADELIATAHLPSPAPPDRQVIPRLWKLRGDAQSAHGSRAAEAVLREAIQTASEQGAWPLVWRLQVSLGSLTRSEEDADAARQTIQQIAVRTPDSTLRGNFTAQANAMIPPVRSPTVREIAKKEYAGLTAREREVAVMIAQGKTNREIADMLVVTERTIETHVGNVLAKLGFGSRAQIAAWVVDKGLR